MRRMTWQDVGTTRDAGEWASERRGKLTMMELIVMDGGDGSTWDDRSATPLRLQRIVALS